MRMCIQSLHVLLLHAPKLCLRIARAGAPASMTPQTVELRLFGQLGVLEERVNILAEHELEVDILEDSLRFFCVACLFGALAAVISLRTRAVLGDTKL